MILYFQHNERYIIRQFWESFRGRFIQFGILFRTVVKAIAHCPTGHYGLMGKVFQPGVDAVKKGISGLATVPKAVQ